MVRRNINYSVMKNISIHSTKQIELNFQNSSYYTQVNNLENENKKSDNLWSTKGVFELN